MSTRQLDKGGVRVTVWTFVTTIITYLLANLPALQSVLEGFGMKAEWIALVVFAIPMIAAAITQQIQDDNG